VVIEQKEESKSSQSNHWISQREKILNAAMMLFYEKGFDGASIQDIAYASEVNKATIYYYFENKQALLYEIASNTLDILINMAQKVMNSGLSPQNKLKRLIFDNAIWVINHPRNATTTLLESRNLSPKLAMDIVNKRDYYRGMFCKLLEELMPKDNSRYIGSEIATHFVFGLLHSLPYWCKSDGELSAREVASMVHTFISSALCIPK